MADHNPTMDTSTRLAYDRTRLAYERTLMAWVRTGVSLISFGFTIYKFFEEFHKPEQIPVRTSLISAREFGLIMITIGLIAVLLATVQHVKIMARQADMTTYTDFRHRVGRALLLGLEILVAADIIRTVVLEPTLSNVLVLGLLVLIRTFLSWSLILEIDERWPWQAARSGTRDEQT